MKQYLFSLVVGLATVCLGYGVAGAYTFPCPSACGPGNISCTDSNDIAECVAGVCKCVAAAQPDPEDPEEPEEPVNP